MLATWGTASVSGPPAVVLTAWKHPQRAGHHGPFDRPEQGFGFVEMGSDAEAQAAISALDSQDHGGRALKVNEAKPRESRAGSGSGGPRRY